MHAKQLPDRPSVEQYRKQAEEFFKECRSPESIRRIRENRPGFSKLSEEEIGRADFKLSDAQFVIAREHAFESWPKFEEHLVELARLNSPVSRFELAADAIPSGDDSTLKRLLIEYPGLARARSARLHHAPLIHYVAANGVEDFRQRTPGNIVEITGILLKAGAEIDAASQAYGGASTALGLAATSYHPAKAGVQLELLQTLLDAGASVDGAPGGWNPLVAALHNGHGDAAAFLGERGAHRDLEGAAGTGRVDEVAHFVAEKCALKAGATEKQLAHGFIWACEYGHAGVVAFLLDHGFKPDPDFMRGQTGLHWASYRGSVQIVELLLKSGMGVNALDRVHQGTPLSWALHGWENPAPEFSNTRHHDVVERLVQAGAEVDWSWINCPGSGSSTGDKIRSDDRMMAALRAKN